MLTKDQILKKIQILITNHFKSPEEAFRFFDKNGDEQINWKEFQTAINQISN